MAIPRVSDIRRFTTLSKRPLVLLAVGVLFVAVVVGYGHVARQWLDQRIASLALAWGVVVLQVALVVASTYVLGLAVTVFVLGVRWRDTYLIPYIPRNEKDPENYLRRVGDKTFAFWSVMVAVGVLIFIALHVGAGGYLVQFPNRGYVLVSFRSDAPIAQERAMRDIVRRDLMRWMDADSFRTRALELLQSDDQKVVAQAAWMVGRTQLLSLDPTVRTLLKHPNGEVREQAALALGQLRTPQGQRALLDALHHEKESAVVKAILIAIGLARNPDLNATLIEGLPDMDDDLRPYALWAMGESADLCVGDAVMAYVGPDRPLATRCAAMETMKKIGTMDQLQAIQAVFDGDDPWCELVTWYGRSSDKVKRDFYRMLIRPERMHEKALDAWFNVGNPGLKDELADIINDTEQEWLDRKHARVLYDYIDPKHPREARTASHCANHKKGK